MRLLDVHVGRPGAPSEGVAWAEGEAGWTRLVSAEGEVPRASVDALHLGRALAPLGQAPAHALLRACRTALRGGGAVHLELPDLNALIERYGAGVARDPVAEAHGAAWLQSPAERVNRSLAGVGWLYDPEEATLLAQRVGLDVESLTRGPDGWLRLALRRPWPQLEERPLVSVLMTAYKPTYFREALGSVLAQTWDHVEVLIFDDSPDGQIGEIVSSFSDPRVRYHKNPERIRSQRNYVQAFAAAQGALVKFVCDDDRLMPTCIERMVRCLQAHPDVTLVTSARDLIDEKGQVQPPIGATRRPCTVDSRMDGALVTHLLLENQINFVGEPTTTMFRRADLAWVRPHLISYKGMPAVGNGDVTKWLNLLGRGDLIYLVEPQSQFRLHAQQAQRTEPLVAERGVRAWGLNRQQATDLGAFSSGSIPLRAPEPLEPSSPAESDAALPLDPNALVTASQGEAWTRRALGAGVTPQLPKVVLELMRRFPRSIVIRFHLASALSALGLAEPAGKVWALAKELASPIQPVSGIDISKLPITVAPVAVFTILGEVPAMTAILQLSTASLREPVELTIEEQGSPVRQVQLAAGEDVVQVSLPIEFRPTPRLVVLRWSRAGGIAADESLHLHGFGAVLRPPRRG